MRDPLLDLIEEIWENSFYFQFYKHEKRIIRELATNKTSLLEAEGKTWVINVVQKEKEAMPTCES